MTDIDALSASVYADGTDPIGWACRIIETQIDAWDLIRQTRTHTPGAYPAYIVPLTYEALARQLVGRLLDAGWTPPDEEHIRTRVAEHRAKTLAAITELEAGRIPPALAADFGDMDPDACRRLAEGMRRTLETPPVTAEPETRG